MRCAKAAHFLRYLLLPSATRNGAQKAQARRPDAGNRTCDLPRPFAAGDCFANSISAFFDSCFLAANRRDLVFPAPRRGALLAPRGNLVFSAPRRGAFLAPRLDLVCAPAIRRDSLMRKGRAAHRPAPAKRRLGIGTNADRPAGL